VQYRNPWNRLRIGRVLEDLDSLAGNIAFAHCDDGNPLTHMPLLVTAAVEQIKYLQHVSLDQDVTLAGQVVYTGSSSIDIRLTLQQLGTSDPSLVALFTFVARDPSTKRAARVNPVLPGTDLEKTWFLERQQLAAARKAARKSLKESGPGSEAHLGADPSQRAAVERAAALVEEALAARVMPGALACLACLASQLEVNWCC
jgi:acyl-coenzyme A thioesterase 9